VLQANGVPARRSEGLPAPDEGISGEPPAEAVFEESGLRFVADLAAGQKTGFYCDQRESRRRAEGLAGGRSVLDLFAHSSAFGLYARRGGASRVVSVESSPRLVEQGRRHHELNGFDAAGAEWIQADVFELLRRETELGRFDLVVCDPPPLARRRTHRDAGARAYKDLNRIALARVAPGGLFFTFSCSAAVDAKLFRQILFSAAVEARVRLSLLAPLAAAPDHPVAVTHPEGEYLKGWLCRVVGPVL
jgi:23S rRNA (cytosine1962-C5)-methyltransferase